MEWRVLVVDDLQADDVSEIIEGNKVVGLPDSITCVRCTSFSEATKLLTNEKFDLVILDLKDDSSEDQEELAGQIVFEELKKCRFLPVVFHTGYPTKVDDLVSLYVKVVTRGDDPKKLRAAVKSVLDTKLPKLIRHIEEEQRKFMWESAEKIWAEDLDKESPSDLVYLLARRLANALAGDVVRGFLTNDGPDGVPQSDKVHAVELYVYPPLSKSFLFGDIFRIANIDPANYFIALTPSCDHAQNNADFVIIAKCTNLVDTDSGRQAKDYLTAGNNISKNVCEQLTKHIIDKKGNADRYKYLPGTSFLPDLVVDFQEISTISVAELAADANKYERIASLDSPFAESLQAKMTRYLGRIGTPDIDSELALKRFIEKIRPAQIQD